MTDEKMIKEINSLLEKAPEKYKNLYRLYQDGKDILLISNGILLNLNIDLLPKTLPVIYITPQMYEDEEFVDLLDIRAYAFFTYHDDNGIRYTAPNERINYQVGFLRQEMKGKTNIKIDGVYYKTYLIRKALNLLQFDEYDRVELIYVETSPNKRDLIVGNKFGFAYIKCNGNLG